MNFILLGYFTILSLMCLYGFHRWRITRLYLRGGEAPGPPAQRFAELPSLTVQLPIYNERLVVERLIDACAALDYPAERLQIQVLDDSTDDSRELVQARVAYWRARGVNIVHIARNQRTGFKAGALAEGLKQASGEFVAIFDADFVPPPTFLRDAIDHFTDPAIGMVQMRWDHLNRHRGLLTEVQAILLDAHFIIEHGGRCRSQRFFNFNGTAGIWRKCCIEQAGGWQHDTLTEDLDLSYRAQLAGWRFLFLPQLTCPAELPARVDAFKSQQYRWAKGSIQVMRKLLPQIWRSRFPLSVKLEASFHLTGNLCYLLMLINSIAFVIPAMVLRQGLPWKMVLFVDGFFFLFLSMTFIYFYTTAQRFAVPGLWARLRFVPALMALGIGLTVNNARAVIDALLGRQSPFVRTPKQGDNQSDTRGYRLPFSPWSLVELGLGLLYSGAIIWAISNGVWASLPFLLLFQNGFFFMGLSSLWESRGTQQAPV